MEGGLSLKVLFNEKRVPQFCGYVVMQYNIIPLVEASGKYPEA